MELGLEKASGKRRQARRRKPDGEEKGECHSHAHSFIHKLCAEFPDQQWMGHPRVDQEMEESRNVTQERCSVLHSIRFDTQ